MAYKKGSRNWQRHQRKLAAQRGKLGTHEATVPEPIMRYRKTMSLLWRMILGHGISANYFVCPVQGCWEVLDTRMQYRKHYNGTHKIN